jgi:hypothetical protein
MLYVHHDRSFSSSRNQHTDGSSTSSRVVDVEDVLLEDVKLDMLHHTCTRLSLCGPDGTTRVMVYGGRYSPRRAVNAWPIILSVSSWDVGRRLTVASSNTAATDGKHAPVPRWRHSAVCLKSSTPTPIQDYVVVFGGRTLDFRVSLTITFWCNILPVVLFGWETWSCTLRDEPGGCSTVGCQGEYLSGPERDEVTGSWEKCMR